MTSTTANTTTVHVFRVYIRATPQAIWDAIVTPEWQAKYGYRAPGRYDLRPGGAYEGIASPAMEAMGASGVIVEGEVVEVDPPRRLVQTWHPTWDPQIAAEAPTRLTWEIDEIEKGVCKVTVTHDVTGAPSVEAQITGAIEHAGGGWAYVLSDLKTLLETGTSLED
jgi:uncharacterized protein YndB with AHSA1/START domain